MVHDFSNIFLPMKGLTCDGGHKIAVPTCKIILCALNEKIVRRWASRTPF